MLNTDQSVSYVNIWNVLRTPVLHNWDACAASNLPPLVPTLTDFTDNGNLNQIQWASTSVEYFPNEEIPNLVLWSTTFAEYSVNGGHVNAASVTTEPKPCFDFGCNVLVSAVKVIADFISDSKSWERFYRANISSSAVSKDGHLSFLIPSYREVCIKTAARDHVVHLEVITLAEEQEAPPRYIRCGPNADLRREIMDENDKQFAEFVLRLFGKGAVVWFYRRWLEFRERRSPLVLLDIPRPTPRKKSTTKPAKKRPQKKTPSVLPPSVSAALHGRFCPECGQEKR